MNSFVGFVTDAGKLQLDHRPAFDAFVKRLAGEEVTISIRKKRTKRSARANAAFHACLDRWAKDCQHDIEQLKDDLLALRWGYIVSQNLFTGEVVKRLVKPHTSQLSVEEFTELFDLAAVEAAKDGHVMEMPDEFNARKQAEAKRGKAA